MSHIWQLQDAQLHLGDLIKEAEKNGAQLINYQGKAKAVVLSIASYRNLLKPKNTLVEFFQQSPLVGVSLELNRDQDTGREIDLE
jgi:antitoxin Phd